MDKVMDEYGWCYQLLNLKCLSSTGRLLIYPKTFCLWTFVTSPLRPSKKICLTLKTLFTSEKDLTFNEQLKYRVEKTIYFSFK